MYYLAISCIIHFFLLSRIAFSLTSSSFLILYIISTLGSYLTIIKFVSIYFYFFSSACSFSSLFLVSSFPLPTFLFFWCNVHTYLVLLYYISDVTLLLILLHVVFKLLLFLRRRPFYFYVRSESFKHESTCFGRNWIFFCRFFFSISLCHSFQLIHSCCVVITSLHAFAAIDSMLLYVPNFGIRFLFHPLFPVSLFFLFLAWHARQYLLFAAFTIFL